MFAACVFVKSLILSLYISNERWIYFSLGDMEAEFLQTFLVFEKYSFDTRKENMCLERY